MKEKPIFIVGCNRSGTTLLQFILDAHPKIGIAPETHFFIDLKVMGRKKQDILNEMFRKCKYWKKIGLSKEELKKNIQIDSRKNFFNSLIRAQARLRGKQIFGEKTPDHIFYVADIKKMYPEAKFIQVIRDPRAVAISQVKKVAVNRFPYAYHCAFNISRKWQKTSDLGMKYKTLYNNYKIIKFEDLVMKPQNVISSVCNFLDVEPHEDMFNPPVINSSFENKKKETFNRKAISRWRSHLSLPNQFIISLIDRRGIKQFNYDRQVI